MSFAVRETIENNDVFKMCFPDVQPSEKWAEKEWRVKGCIGLHPTFAALGIDGAIPGFRWNFVGLDDLIKPEKVRESNLTPADVEAVIFTVQNVIMKRLVEGGCACLTNTRWFERDPTSWAIDPPPKGQGWTPIIIKALDENDESFWEEREIFTAKNLIAERERDPEGFALQFQGEPAPDTGITFKREWLQYTYPRVPWMEADETTANYMIVEAWDTAGTKNARSDETAGWRAAIDLRSWDIYLMNMWHDKLEMDKLLEAILGSYDTLPHPAIVWIEDKATGQPAAQLLRYSRVPIWPIKSYGERGQPRLQDVINQIKPMLATGKVHFPSPDMARDLNMTWVFDAKKALLMYPRGQHDDIPRSFIMLLYECLKWQGQMSGYDPNEKSMAWGTPTGERLIV